MSNFPVEIHNVLHQIAEEFDIELLQETHYESINQELQWFGKKKLFRLNFNFDESRSIVTVDYYIDEFPFRMPKAFIWMHNNIPNFKYLADVRRHGLGEIPLGLSSKEYKSIIIKLIDRAANLA